MDVIEEIAKATMWSREVANGGVGLLRAVRGDWTGRVPLKVYSPKWTYCGTVYMTVPLGGGRLVGSLWSLVITLSDEGYDEG